MYLKYYIYTHKDRFLKNPECNHSKANFLGQVYEASFFERLREHCVSNGHKLVAAHPYLKPKKVKDGFYASNSGGVIYSSQNVEMFEFDAIKYSSNEVVFYECLISDLRKAITAHKKSCLRKKFFLESIFPNHDVKCVIVSDKQKVLQYFENNACFGVVNHQITDVDLMVLAKQNRPKVLPFCEELISPASFSQIPSRFDYSSQQINLSNEINEGLSVIDAEKKIDYIGRVVKRAYLGMISVRELGENLGLPNDETIVVVVDFTSSTKPKLRYFVDRKGISEVFVGAKKAKLLNRYKATRSEILKYKNKIQTLAKSRYVQVKSELSSISL